MIRRTVLGTLAATLGLGAVRSAVASPVGRLVDSPFPYPTYRVSGAEALAEWERLRAIGQGYPVVVGAPEDALMLAELPQLNGRSVAEVLQAAARLRIPEDLIALRSAEEGSEWEAWLNDPDLVGERPGDAPPNPPLSLARDVLSDRWLPEVLIVVLPTDDAAEALAMLSYGGWNACPATEYHVAATRSWRERFGFELVAVGHDTIEGRVMRRPSEDEARALALEQYVYCADIVDQGVSTLAALADVLAGGDWWFFWWD